MTEVRRNLEYEYVFATNSQGLRSKEIPLRKPDGIRRIFVAGDSFTEGIGVADGERYTDVLEGLLRAEGQEIDVINGGLAGTGPLQQGRLLLNVGLQYGVDGVLIAVYANDLGDLPASVSVKEVYAAPSGHYSSSPGKQEGGRALTGLLWPRTKTALGTLFEKLQYRRWTRTFDFVRTITQEANRRGIERERIEEWKTKVPRGLVTATNKGEFNGALLSIPLLYPAFWTDCLDLDSEVAEGKWRGMAGILTEIVNVIRGLGIEVGVAFLPVSLQYDPASHDPDNPSIRLGWRTRREWLVEATEIEKRLEAWARENKAPYLDLTPVFRAASGGERELNWKLDGHWNAEGHRVAAQAIYQWIRAGRVFSFVEGRRNG